jgi:hypothetical protein
MVRNRTGVALLAAVLAIVCMLPGRALASGTQQTMLMDDNQLIYSPPAHVVEVLKTLHALGVDRVKVSVVWLLVAPNSQSSHKPKFDATNPAAYPAGAWDRYDLIDEVAHSLGMGVYFQLDPPVPVWAIPSWQPRQGPRLSLAPAIHLFRDFIEAVGKRYSGTYEIRTTKTTTTDANGDSVPVQLPVGVPGLTDSQPKQHTTTTATTQLPRVSFWSVWNEPNERSWLSPTHRTLHDGVHEQMQPALYRALVDAAWAALGASGHRGDTFLVGETANRGLLTPAQFIRGVYCVSSHFAPLTRRSAEAEGCPTHGDRSAFVNAHPGLFQATGFAHHPYSFDVAPNRRYPDATFYTMYNIASFEALVNNCYAAYGQLPRGGVPLYLTEWGYKTDPPNPYAHTSLAQQATWLDDGAFIAWQSRYIRALTQFLLVDDKPKASAAAGSRAYWGTFQTGLMTIDGAPKPAFDTYPIPIWIPHPRHGSRVTVWGQLRAADHSGNQYAVLEFKPSGSSSWEGLREIQTASPEGFLLAHVAIPGPGLVKLAWLNDSGSVFYSRAVKIG